MNETLKVLETRRSCRNFKSDMVEQDKIAEKTVKLVVGEKVSIHSMGRQ